VTSQRRRRSGSTAVGREGLTLVEACALTCVGGVVLAVAVPTFSRQLRTSKTAEAAEQLATLHRAAAAYYAQRHENADGRRRDHCLPEAAGPAPAEPTASPRQVDFAATSTPGSATWRALGFAPAEPTRFRYSVVPVETGCGVVSTGDAHVVGLVAEGDLDGDHVLSRFERRATTRDGELVPAGVLVVTQRNE
jgi:type II secretory pathway pseudopilin PulG